MKAFFDSDKLRKFFNASNVSGSDEILLPFSDRVSSFFRFPSSLGNLASRRKRETNSQSMNTLSGLHSCEASDWSGVVLKLDIELLFRS